MRTFLCVNGKLMRLAGISTHILTHTHTHTERDWRTYAHTQNLHKLKTFMQNCLPLLTFVRRQSIKLHVKRGKGRGERNGVGEAKGRRPPPKDRGEEGQGSAHVKHLMSSVASCRRRVSLSFSLSVCVCVQECACVCMHKHVVLCEIFENARHMSWQPLAPLVPLFLRLIIAGKFIFN